MVITCYTSSQRQFTRRLVDRTSIALRGPRPGQAKGVQSAHPWPLMRSGAFAIRSTVGAGFGLELTGCAACTTLREHGWGWKMSPLTPPGHLRGTVVLQSRICDRSRRVLHEAL